LGAIDFGTWSVFSRGFKGQIDMSQAALFGFGCVIFFVVATGALLYGMAAVKEFADRTQ